ncbi:MAG: chemotaxis protein CheX [Dehalococcoidia bacterium]|nr:chemotaxis protein CheX [Dehalococcoidia bacterium]
MHAKITVAEAALAAADASDRARLEFVAPFIEAAASVLFKECGETVAKGKLHRVRSPQTSNDVSVLIAITGSVAGLVVYSMPEATACALAAKMMGEPVVLFDAIPQSAIAELANIVTGQAGIALEQAGFATDMSPPVLLVGHGSSIATFNLTRLVVPLIVSTGEFLVDIALKEM